MCVYVTTKTIRLESKILTMIQLRMTMKTKAYETNEYTMKYNDEIQEILQQRIYIIDYNIRISMTILE